MPVNYVATYMYTLHVISYFLHLPAIRMLFATKLLLLLQILNMLPITGTSEHCTTKVYTSLMQSICFHYIFSSSSLQ